MKNPKVGEIVTIYDGKSVLQGRIVDVSLSGEFCGVLPSLGEIKTYHRKQLRRPKPIRNPVPPNIIEIEMSRDLYDAHYLPIFSPPKIDKNSYGDYLLSMGSTCRSIYTLKYMLFETIPVED